MFAGFRVGGGASGVPSQISAKAAGNERKDDHTTPCMAFEV